ncbi:MAG: hypothetical protein NZT61_03645 [Deltaproteobacteria bacterium]|nr:hypothetical protein [Deltaproteobacteria bacterium]
MPDFEITVNQVRGRKGEEFRDAFLVHWQTSSEIFLDLAQAKIARIRGKILKVAPIKINKILKEHLSMLDCCEKFSSIP